MNNILTAAFSTLCGNDLPVIPDTPVSRGQYQLSSCSFPKTEQRDLKVHLTSLPLTPSGRERVRKRKGENPSSQLSIPQPVEWTNYSCHTRVHLQMLNKNVWQVAIASQYLAAERWKAFKSAFSDKNQKFPTGSSSNNTQKTQKTRKLRTGPLSCINRERLAENLFPAPYCESPWARDLFPSAPHPLITSPFITERLL